LSISSAAGSFAEPAWYAQWSREPLMEVKDCHGNILSQGDSVLVIKDLKVKGTSVTLKQGTKIKNIRLTEDEEEIACNTDKVKGLILKTCFLKKA